MKRSKKVFLIVGFIFFVIMIYVGYDISSRTTFPGSKPQLKERILHKKNNPDSTYQDSARTDD